MIRQPLQAINTFSTTSTTSSSSTFIAPNNDYLSLVGKLTVTTLSGGTSPTLDVYYQTTDDGGTTWYDVAHLTQATGATTSPIWTTVNSGSQTTAVHGAVGDATVTAGNVGIPLLSRNIRIKYVYAGSPTAANWTLVTNAHNQG